MTIAKKCGKEREREIFLDDGGKFLKPTIDTREAVEKKTVFSSSFSNFFFLLRR
jgi:hypothetical protein